MLCTCHNQFKFDERGSLPESKVENDASRELFAKAKERESKLSESSFEGAEASLQEAPTANNEEARALLGRLEYQRGNIEGALQAFEGIQLKPLVSRMRFFVSEPKVRNRKGKPSKEDELGTFLQAAGLLLEAIYLKAKSLQKLGRLAEAAQECKSVLEAMHSAVQGGTPSTWGDTTVEEIVSKSGQLLPELLLEAGRINEAMSAYRRVLSSFTWCLNVHDRMHMMKEFAVLLLYGGVEAPGATLGAHVEGAYTPKHNTEEAILLLMIFLRMKNEQEGSFDSTVLDHLTFALSVSGQSAVLAHQYEELLPGILSRCDRWYNVALCYCGSDDFSLALDLLRKCLNQVERPNDVASLILAAKLCCRKLELASEGVEYAQKALGNMNGSSLSSRVCALHILGVALGLQISVASSDSMKTRLHREALEALEEAAALDSQDPLIIFDLGLEFAEQRQLISALHCAKQSLDRRGGRVEEWRFLPLLLTALERHAEAEVVLEAALEETGTWEQGPLLRTQAKVQLALDQPLKAVQTYRLLLGLVQAERKNLEAGRWTRNQVGGRVEEVEVWQDLAQVYTELKQWRDAEVCLEKAQALGSFSSTTWHYTGLLHEAQGQLEEASVCYKNALAVNASHVDSKVKLGALLLQQGGRASLPVARSYVAEALQAEPTHEGAWYQMGLLHKEEDCPREAANCFQAALMLEESSPVEKFSSLTRALLWGL